MTNRHPAPAIELRDFFPYRLSILEQRVSQSLARFYSVDFNLSRFEWRVMATLAMHPPMTATAIGSFTLLDKMQVSRAIQGLDKAELVKLQPCPADKRAKLLSLSDKGQQMYQQIVPKVTEQERKLLSCLSESERNALKTIIDKLDEALDQTERE